MKSSETAPDFLKVIQRLVAKAIAKAHACELKFEMRVTPVRHQQYGSQIAHPLVTS
ncbi:hypothetical protein [Marinobacterium aestuariivivens]|uniref:Uncharacterized protein n=1 Tax=Marinobacterium aestuariivivens TaxID=1698799 RepID=A0ABW2A506_9GAMM